MQIVSLKISGFKSFAEPTEIQFAPGLSALVGPNGCGKSNILEAMRWVMGESSAKRVRSAGDMEDIIFAGTPTRASFSRAEVTITLHNETPTQTQETDTSVLAHYQRERVVKVARRIESGAAASTYSINGREVLARDVQTLFADLGLGASASALVGQGQVATLVEAKPLERRQLIEEAAGVRGLYNRRREAENTLEGALSALQRVEERMHALQQQKRKLGKDSVRARAYRTLSERIERSSAVALYRDSRDNDGKQADSARGREKAEHVRAQAAAHISKAEHKALEQKVLYEAARKQEIEAAARCQNLQQDARVLEARRAAREQEKARIERQRIQLEKDLQENQHAVTEAEHILDQAEQERQEQEEQERLSRPRALQAHDKRRQADALAKQREEVQKTLQRLENKQRELEAQQAVLAERLAQARARTEELARSLASEPHQEQDAAAAAAAASALRAQLETCAGELAALQTETLPQLRQREQQALRTQESLAQEHQRRLAQLQTREQEAQNLWETLRAFAEQEDLLLVALSCQPEWRKALYAALGQDLLAPIARTAQNAETSPRYWRTNFSPSPSPSPSPLPPSAAEPKLSALPESAPSLARYVEVPRAMPTLQRRLEQVAIAENAEQGRRLQTLLAPGQRVVTRTGACWRWDGFTSSAKALDSFLQRIEALEKIDGLRQELQSCAREAQQQQQHYRKEKEALARTLEETQSAHAKAAQQQKRCYESRTDLQVRLAQIEAQGRAAESRRARLQQQQSEHKEATRLVAETERALALALAALDSTEPVARERAALEAQKSALEEEKAKLEQDFERTARAHEIAQSALQRLAQERGRWGKIKQQAEQRFARAQESLATLALVPSEDFRRQEGELAQQQQQADRRHERARAALESCQAERTRTQTQRDSWREKDAVAEKNEIRLEAEQQHLAQERARLLAECQDQFQCAPDALVAKFELDAAFLGQDPDEQRSQRRADLVARERLGLVNLTAEHDLGGVEQELSEMSRQNDDVQQAVRKLRDSIQHLNAEAAVRIERVHRKVSGYFSAFFSRLFEGGRAELRFAEPQDPIASGLEIRVSIPGKRVTALNALSGGEQTLIAIALILAVFDAHEGKFCVLDEVDAALDDENVVRFCNLIEHVQQQRNARFLLVTHHRHTMSCVQRLYGVAMPEPGCSQVYPVDLEKALQNAQDSEQRLAASILQ